MAKTSYDTGNYNSKRTLYTTMRSNGLAICDIDGPFESWYNDLQNDRRKFLPELFAWMAIGYGMQAEDGTATFVSPEEAAVNRSKLIGDPKKEEIATQFIDTLLEGGKGAATSCYSLFFHDFKSTGKAKITPRRRTFIKEICNKTDEEIEAYLEQDKQFAQVRDQIPFIKQHSHDPEEVWKHICTDMADLDRTLGVRVRVVLGGFKCARPEDNGYCKILTEILGRQLRSIRECYQNHIEETERQRLEVERVRTPLAELVCEFANRLEQVGSGLSKTVLFGCLRNKTSVKLGIQVAIIEVAKPEFFALRTARTEDVRKAYTAWRKKQRLERRQLYPLYPKVERDYKIPVGKTGLGNFDLSLNDGRISLKLNGTTYPCLRSHYFSFVSMEKQDAGYHIQFRHKLKSRKKEVYGPEIEGVVKEIGIQKVKDSYRLTLPYMISHDAQNFIIRGFFRTAQPEPKDIRTLPPKMTVVAFDLNIINPVCAVKAELSVDSQGKLSVPDYGRGDIVDAPMILASNGPFCQPLIDLNNDIYRAKDAVREYKTCIRNGTDFSHDVRTWLSTVNVGQKWQQSHLGFGRYLIQMWVKKIRERLFRLKQQIRSQGNKNLGECIRLLDCMDQFGSLQDSYERIHLKPGEQLPKKRQFDNRRANFRRYTLQLFGSCVTNYARGSQVAFLEDLDADFDRDNNNNSLTRLFSPATLLATIVSALEKAGIGVVFINKNGTSRTDPVTGDLGYRDYKNDKDKLYVVRNGNLGWIHADKAAALNVLLVGLNHSIVPYKFFVQDDKDEDKKERKRMDRFMKEAFGKKSVRFYEADGIVTTAGKLKHLGRTYYHADQLVNEAKHLEMENEIKKIKDIAVFAGEVPEFALTGDHIETYKNFSIEQVRDRT